MNSDSINWQSVALLGVGQGAIMTAHRAVVLLLEDKPIFDALRMKNVPTRASAPAKLHESVRDLLKNSSVTRVSAVHK